MIPSSISRGEPAIHLLTQRGEIHPPRLVVGGEVDVVPHPVEIHRGIDAVILQQRHGDARDGGRLHIRKSALQHGDAAHADNGLDLPRLDERHDDGRALRHQDRVAEPLRLRLQILDGAEAALLAEQAEFIERRRAFALDAEALREQEEPALERHRGQRLAPELVVQQHADVVAVERISAEPREQLVRMHLQLLQRQRRHGLHLGHVLADELQKAVPLDRRLRDVLLRLAEALDRHGPRDGEGWSGGHKGVSALGGAEASFE